MNDRTGVDRLGAGHVMFLRWLLPVWLLAAPSALDAKPPHKESLKRYYGPLLSANQVACVTCHLVPAGTTEKQLAEETPEHNPFGKRLRELRSELEAKGEPAEISVVLQLVASEDADGDGVGNELELIAGRSPGDGKDCPTKDELSAAEGKQREFQARYRWHPFDTVTRPPVPSEKMAAAWRDNPVDAFVAREQVARGLGPRPLAKHEALLRRIYLDLIGLPPTREELHAFLKDETADAYERVVERLLASPQYGERWGRHWMDIWRYSDWAGWGEQVRDSQPHVWRWRDWIVESIAADKPYDQMTREMLAGDELYPEDADVLRATGFLVRNYKLLSRETWMQETVEHTAQAFLGLTFKCARCHDHLYDPISQKDYYRLRAFFEPYQVRIDRLPGQTDVAKGGLARVYDADAAAATYLFRRGDDRDPDKEHPLPPGVPASCGGKGIEITTVSLPLTAYAPDKRSFVIEEEVAACKGAVEAAQKKIAAIEEKIKAAPENEKATAQRERWLSEFEVGLAEARRDALTVVLAVEQMGDAGNKEKDPVAWETAAKGAHVAQRRVAFVAAQAGVRAAENELAAASKAQGQALIQAGEKPEAGLKQSVEKATQALAAAQKKLDQAQATLAGETAKQAQPATTAFEPRKGKTFPVTSTGRRSALAKWIANPRNPLFARVGVNHIWLRHFGTGLAGSPFDFGANAPPPTNPALLDWLAAEFAAPSVVQAVANGRLQWVVPNEASRSQLASAFSMKHIHRLLVTSRTYRLAATNDERNQRIDPENRYYWRAPARRMEAEVVRDSLLHVAGSLDATRGGPDLNPQDGLSNRRRSLYFRHAQEKQMQFLKLFDVAAPNECYQRKETIVPQQALALANSDFAWSQARKVGRQLQAEFGQNEQGLIEAAFEMTLGRLPRGEEVTACAQFLNEQRQLFEQNQKSLEAGTSDLADLSKPARGPVLRACENLVHVLFNHHEFMTIP